MTALTSRLANSNQTPKNLKATAHPRSTLSGTRSGILSAAIIAAAVLTTGCAATTRSIDPNEDTIHYDANYDFSDKKEIVAKLTDSLSSTPLLNRETNQPIIVTYGIANETAEHINTGGISDDIRLALIQSGDYRFVNRKQRSNALKEADFQYAGFVPPEQRIIEGRQLGANYILAGTLRSIEKRQPKQWRLNKRKLVYYSLNLEMTNIQTGEISWADSVEIARESKQPIIGW